MYVHDTCKANFAKVILLCKSATTPFDTVDKSFLISCNLTLNNQFWNQYISTNCLCPSLAFPSSFNCKRRLHFSPICLNSYKWSPTGLRCCNALSNIEVQKNMSLLLSSSIHIAYCIPSNKPRT